MSLNPLAPAFLPQFQAFCDPAISLGNSTTMSFPLAQLFCGMPAQITLSHVPFINQHITDSPFLFPSLQPTNQCKPNAAPHQPNPESSALLSPPLQHQAKCLQSIHKTIQQFNQYLKAEHLDRQALQLIALQLQNVFVLSRYLLFSDQGTAAKDSTTSPIIYPNPHPTSSTFSLPFADDAQFHRSTPVGAVGPSREKTNNSVNAGLQPILNTQEVPPTTVQNLASRICKLEKLFADEIATYTSITAGIHAQYFFLYDKIRQLEPGNSDAIIWKIPWVKFVFDSAKRLDHHLTPSLNRQQVLVVLSSGLIPMDTFFHQVLPLWYWTRFWQVCFSSIHPLPWRFRQSSQMALLKAHPHWYSRSTGPNGNLGEKNPTGSRPSLQEAHNVNKNWSRNSPN